MVDSDSSGPVDNCSSAGRSGPTVVTETDARLGVDVTNRFWLQTVVGLEGSIEGKGKE